MMNQHKHANHALKQWKIVNNAIRKYTALNVLILFTYH